MLTILWVGLLSSVGLTIYAIVLPDFQWWIGLSAAVSGFCVMALINLHNA